MDVSKSYKSATVLKPLPQTTRHSTTSFGFTAGSNQAFTASKGSLVAAKTYLGATTSYTNPKAQKSGKPSQQASMTRSARQSKASMTVDHTSLKEASGASGVAVK